MYFFYAKELECSKNAIKFYVNFVDIKCGAVFRMMMVLGFSFKVGLKSNSTFQLIFDTTELFANMFRYKLKFFNLLDNHLYLLLCGLEDKEIYKCQEDILKDTGILMSLAILKIIYNFVNENVEAQFVREWEFECEIK